MTKLTKWHLRPANGRAQWVAKDQGCRHADSEDSDQTGRMPFCWFCHGAAHLYLVLIHDLIAFTFQII